MKATVNKKSLIFLMPFLVGFGVFILGASARAGWATDIMSGILSVFIWALGIILGLVLQGLIAIASYQHFIDSQAVVLGWVIVRDICNMFFVVVLMIIAFGTILHIEEYNYKKWLPKLILMAVLINFSKTICGVLIDVTQVAMLTFVNAFKDIGGGNATEMLGIKDIVTLSATDNNTGFLTVVGAYVLGIIYLIVSIVVIVTMMMMLVMRLVMIWIYVVLSPAAYLLAAFPGGQKYSSQWWSEFVKNLIVGPVLAFFIWLSLAALGTGNDLNNMNTAQADLNNQQYNDTLKGDSFAGTEASRPSALIKFVIAIGMLVGGLMVSQQIGGAAGGMAGKGMSALQKGQAMGMAGLKGLAKAPMLPIGYGVDKLQQHTGVDLNVKRAWGVMQAKRKEIKEKQYAEGQIAAGKAMEEGGRVHGMLAITGNAGDAYEQMSTWKGLKKRLKGGRAMAEDRDLALSEGEEAKTDFARADFADKWVNGSKMERETMMKNVAEQRDNTSVDMAIESKNLDRINKELEVETAKSPVLQDREKINKLNKEKEDGDAHMKELTQKMAEINPLQRFITDNRTRIDSEYTNEEKRQYADARTNAKKRIDESDKKVEHNTPDYNFEARSAEQHAVAQEVSKIKDITDPSELLRILKDSIAVHDKTMVKAITLKMTKDYNDNEFLKPLAGRTDHIGLKKLMNDLSDSNSDNYAGFSQQEAYGLGSQIAEINKSTNHAAATAAYTMENGRWRETTDKEHHQIRDIETGKQQLQAFLRNNNRLAYGYHDEKGAFHLDEGGLIKLMAIDTPAGHKNMETMNESAAGFIFEALKNNKKLWDRFTQKNKEDGKSLVDALRTRLGEVAGGRSIDIKLAKISDIYK